MLSYLARRNHYLTGPRRAPRTEVVRGEGRRRPVVALGNRRADRGEAVVADRGGYALGGSDFGEQSGGHACSFGEGSGVLRAGAFADVTVFDASKVIDKSTFPDPFHYNEGIEAVVVNGRLVLDHGKPTGERPGRALRRGL